MNSYDRLWQIIHNELKKAYPKELMELWLDKLELVHLDEKTAVIVFSDSEYFINIINKSYAGHIAQLFHQCLNMSVDVKIVAKNSYNESDYVSNGKSLSELTAISKDSFDNDDDEYDDYINYPLNNEKTFENFVVGSSNKFAYNACYAVANEPTSNYNPLLIYSDSGLGKTHLIRAISNRLKQTHPDYKTVFVTGEKFTNEFLDALKKGTTEDFHEKYRNVDVLLIDDIQFIAGKEATQEEFFNTFNILYDNHKQIVLTSDKPPKNIKNLTERITTRFEGGLLVDIQKPDTELKIAILKSKATNLNISLTNEMIMFIVENIDGSIRKLEGVVRNIGAYSYINNINPITMDVVKKTIEPLITEKISPKEISSKIISSVCIMYNVTENDLKDKSRKANIAHARNMAIYAIREKTNLSLESIGNLFNRDHTTIINSIDRISQEIEKNPEVNRDIQEIYKDIS